MTPDARMPVFSDKKRRLLFATCFIALIATSFGFMVRIMLLDEVWKPMFDLTETQKQIFHLKHARKQSIRVIATRLGKSEDAIKANLYRMRRVISQGTPGLKALLEH